MILEGRAVCIPQDDVDTDVLYPGQYLNVDDPELMKPHLFEGLDPSLRDELRGDTVLVVGANFGMGSSREHVPLAMKASGVRCVVGRSFARIFHRNCVNLALPVVACAAAADAARPGSTVRFDTASGEVEVDGRSFRAAPIPEFMLDMLAAGGLVPYARRQLATRGRDS